MTAAVMRVTDYNGALTAHRVMLQLTFGAQEDADEVYDFLQKGGKIEVTIGPPEVGKL